MGPASSELVTALFFTLILSMVPLWSVIYFIDSKKREDRKALIAFLSALCGLRGSKKTPSPALLCVLCALRGESGENRIFSPYSPLSDKIILMANTSLSVSPALFTSQQGAQRKVDHIRFFSFPKKLHEIPVSRVKSKSIRFFFVLRERMPFRLL
jgi:hypothetical protein